MRRWRTVAFVCVVGLALVGCKGQVGDPMGDGIDGNADLVGAGVDYRTATTYLYAYFSRGGVPDVVIWDISTDGDTIPGYRVVLGHGDDHSIWYVRGPGEQVVCEGQIDEPDGGMELTIDTSCIHSPSTGRPSGAVRIRAFSVGPSGISDETGWTEPVVRS
jgi:hypothetical protein